MPRACVPLSTSIVTADVYAAPFLPLLLIVCPFDDNVDPGEGASFLHLTDRWEIRTLSNSAKMKQEKSHVFAFTHRRLLSLPQPVHPAHVAMLPQHTEED